MGESVAEADPNGGEGRSRQMDTYSDDVVAIVAIIITFLVILAGAALYPYLGDAGALISAITGR